MPNLKALTKPAPTEPRTLRPEPDEGTQARDPPAPVQGAAGGKPDAKPKSKWLLTIKGLK